MNNFLVNSQNFKRHFIFWCIYLLYAYILNSWEDSENVFLDILFANLSTIFTCYSSYYILVSFNTNTLKNKFFLFFSFLIVFWIAWLIRYIYWHYLLQLINIKPYTTYNFGLFTRIVIRTFVRDFIIAFAYFYSQKSLLLKKEIEQKEKVILQSELNFLRAQINPHFLQNCLNFIYSDTRKTNPDAADAVMLLSTIMRYSVADNTATGGMALLKDEISQVENILKMQQLRFKEQLHVNFTTAGQLGHKQIVPMILLTLVENLIKYGDLNHSDHPATINCTINEQEKNVYFTATNKKSYSNDIISTGLGLKNIRERLGLIWGNNFRLDKEEINNYYTVKLCMPYTVIAGNSNELPKKSEAILSPNPLNIKTLNP
jgi:two-component system, LytTR family, sensor kinase